MPCSSRPRHLLGKSPAIVGRLRARNNTVFHRSRLPPRPQNLAYELDPSGDPGFPPPGIRLAWDDVQSSDPGELPDLTRAASSSGSFLLRGARPTFQQPSHANGIPHLAVLRHRGRPGRRRRKAMPRTPSRSTSGLQRPKPDTLGLDLPQIMRLPWTGADNAAQSPAVQVVIVFITAQATIWTRGFLRGYRLGARRARRCRTRFLATLLANGDAPAASGTFG